MRLMEHPGVGPATALAFAVTLGLGGRSRKSKHLVSYNSRAFDPRLLSPGGRDLHFPREQFLAVHTHTDYLAAYDAFGNGQVH